MYNLDFLIESADPVEVAEAIGIETKRLGKNVYCTCPSHQRMLGREDNTVGNCIITPHGYHCFACGASGDVIQMVEDFCGLSFYEAVKTIAKITGVNFSQIRCKTDYKELPFSAEDLELIGLAALSNPKGDAGKTILGASDYRPLSGAFFRRGDEYITYASVKKISLHQVFFEDEKLYYKLISENARIALKKYEDLYSSFQNRGSETFSRLFELLSKSGSIDVKMMAEIKNILLLNMKRVRKILEKAEARC